MNDAEKKERIKKLRAQRERAEDNAVKKAHELDIAEREREKLKERDPKTEARIEETASALKVSHKEIAAIREREDEIDDKRDELNKRIDKLAKDIAAGRTQPKIVDLKMAGGSTPIGNIIGSVGHYTAGPLARTDEEAVRLWWQVRSQHMGQGWSNIGYHIGLGPEGGIYLLRPRHLVGAHTLNANTGRIGFSVHGTTGDTWTPAQLAAFRYALNHFGLADKPVWGHNDLGPTACPGSFKNGYVTKGRG